MRLELEDWVYHTYHLATLEEGFEDVKDCRVCEWYRKLKPSSRKMLYIPEEK